MASKKKSPAAADAVALVPINPVALRNRAQSLQVVVSVNPELLGQEVESYTQGGATLALGISSLAIEDPGDLAEGVRLRNEAARREKGLTEIWERFKAPLNAARAEVLEMEHGTVDYFTALKDQANDKINRHVEAEKRAKREADAALERAAQQARQESARRASELMGQGFVRQALEVEAQAARIITPTLPEPDIYVPGNRSIDTYQGDCQDPVALMQAIVEGRYPLLHDVNGVLRPIVTVDQVVINAIVKRQLGEARIPGVVVTEKVRSQAVKL